MSLAARALALVEDLAPAWGIRRAVARASREILASGYSRHGASRTKKSLVGWLTSTGGPDADIVDNLDGLRERSRDLYMGDPLARGGLNTIRTNEIGSGLRLNAQIDAAYLGLSDEQALAWEDTVEREFALWADSKACDAERRCNFGQLQTLARLSQLVSGDVFALLPSIVRAGDRYDIRVRLLEGDRVCDPPQISVKVDVFGGVEVGDQGEPVAYYVVNQHPGDAIARGGVFSLPTKRWERIPAFGEITGRPLVLHLMDMERPGQRRGVPLLAPVVEHLKQLSRYTTAELTAAVVSGFFTAAITSETPQTPIGQALPPPASGNPGEQIDTGNAADYQLGPGSLLGLAPGEKLEAVNPGRPNAGFDPFVQAICRQIGVGLGLPYEVLIKHFTASYSASRAALLEAWKVWTIGRKNHADAFCQPVYEAWLEEAILRGYIEAPGFFTDPVARAAWCGAEWIGPAQGQLDPTKEVDAAARRVEEGFSTRAKETRELTGGDFWAFERARAREEQARRADGLANPTTAAPATVAAAAAAQEMP